MADPRDAAARPDWRRPDAYAYTQGFTRRAWAWEFLRRNRSYQRSWSRASGSVAIETRPPHLTVLTARAQTSDLTRWGCSFADAPEHDAATATAFWDPRLSSHVLPVTAFPAEAPLDTALVRLSRLRCRTVALLLPDGTQHLLFLDAGRALQLAVSGASLFAPVRLLTEAVIRREHLAARCAALACLNHLRVSGELPARYFPGDPRGRRLRVVLQALDGWLAGAAYREIAMALFGRARVDADWTDPGDHLRDRVRRAVRRGRTLMGGGYLQLLRCFLIVVFVSAVFRSGC